MDLKQGLALHLMDVEIAHVALTGKIKIFVPYALPILFKILLAKATVQIVPLVNLLNQLEYKLGHFMMISQIVCTRQELHH